MARAASHFDDNKIMVKKQWCKGCGICTALCAKNVLVLDGRGKAVVANPTACTGCGRCEDHCPDMAIMVDRKAAREKYVVHTGGAFSGDGVAAGYQETVHS